MIKIMNESSEKFLAVKATEKLTTEDYEKTWIPKLNELIDKYGQINAVLYLPAEFKGWTMGAMWDDAKFGIKHKNNFKKIAIVGGPKWVQWGTKLAAHLIKGELKTYNEDELQTAIGWAKK